MEEQNMKENYKADKERIEQAEKDLFEIARCKK